MSKNKKKYSEAEDKTITIRLRKTNIKNELFSYDDLCDLFCSKPTTGEARVNQIASWERFCDIEKVGRKYSISNVKQVPSLELPGSEVKRHIVNILYLYMYMHPGLTETIDGVSKIILSRRELYGILGYVNNNYFSGNELEYVKNNYPTIWADYNARLIGYMNTQISSAFSILRRKRIIDELESYQFRVMDEDRWHQIDTSNNEAEISKLLKCEKDALKEMSYNSYDKQMAKWKANTSEYKDRWKPEFRSFDIGYVFATGQYEDFKRRAVKIYRERYKIPLVDYRRVYHIYIMKSYLEEQLKENLGELFVENTQRFLQEEQLKVNQKTTVKNLESDKRIDAERERFNQTQMKVILNEVLATDKDGGSESGSDKKEKTVYYKKDQNKYNEVVNSCEKEELESSCDKEEFLTDKYIEIFKDITEKLIKIYPDKFYGEGE